jgi:hypothetical protein
VVARERLPDLADSLMPRRPELLGISEDEGTAWVVRGDVAEIVGRNKAFVYGGKDATDSGKPFLTLFPGDKYELASRHVISRASAESPVNRAFLEMLVKGPGKVTVHVAQAGKVLVDEAFNIGIQRRLQPSTTVPSFPLAAMSEPINMLMSQIALPTDAKRGTTGYAAAVNRRVFTPLGAHWTTVDSSGAFKSNVDELYRLELVLRSPRGFANDSAKVMPPRDVAQGWKADNLNGARRLSMYGDAAGHQNAFVRFPDQQISIIILSDRADLDARAIADRIAEQFPALRPNPGSH